MILKSQFTEHPPQSSVARVWTYELDSVRLNGTPPEWLFEVLKRSIGKTRDRWIGRAAPAFSLTDLGGQKVELAAMRGKVVLLDFWGSYCGPCKEQMATVEKLRDEYRARGLEAVGITDDSSEKAQKWLAKNNRSLLTLLDPGRKVFSQFEVEGIPVTVLVGPDGKVAKYWDGLQYEKTLRTAIEAVLP